MICPSVYGGSRHSASPDGGAVVPDGSSVNLGGSGFLRHSRRGRDVLGPDGGSVSVNGGSFDDCVPD